MIASRDAFDFSLLEYRPALVTGGEQRDAGSERRPAGSGQPNSSLGLETAFRARSRGLLDTKRLEVQ